MDNLEELSALVAPLLNDPETMNSLKQAAEQMGFGSLLSGASDGSSEKAAGGAEKKATQPIELPTEMLSAAARLAPLLSAQKEDNTTRLLSALRPFLSQPRAKRLDEAERLLSVTRVLSILKESKLM